MKSQANITKLIIFYFISTLILVSCQASSAKPEIGITPESPPTEEIDPTIKDREEMVLKQIESRGVEDASVLAAMLAVPRHEFVPDPYISQAYADHPLPIGHGQTISQPFIVALMTEVLALEEGDRVLEIGTGSGYQAAILAELDTVVYTVEIIPELALSAEERLSDLGYTNIEVLNEDGYFGWEEHAPFDGVIVTAAPDHLPQPLIEQLDEGARMIIPIGPVGAVQTLWLFEKVEGEIKALNLGPVSFVPLTGEH
jgi:protein-L-isoaspartate(D-aspartate) O-methyltransferase